MIVSAAAVASHEFKFTISNFAFIQSDLQLGTLVKLLPDSVDFVNKKYSSTNLFFCD